MNRQEVIAKIRALELPTQQYVVVVGASMAVRGLRDTADIDLVVTPELFERLAALGWVRKLRPNGLSGLRFECVEAYLEVNTPSCAPDMAWLVAHAEIQHGIPLVDLDTLLSWKRGYGRDKDAYDIELLESIKTGGQGAHSVA